MAVPVAKTRRPHASAMMKPTSDNPNLKSHAEQEHNKQDTTTTERTNHKKTEARTTKQSKRNRTTANGTERSQTETEPESSKQQKKTRKHRKDPNHE